MMHVKGGCSKELKISPSLHLPKKKNFHSIKDSLGRNSEKLTDCKQKPTYEQPKYGGNKNEYFFEGPQLRIFLEMKWFALCPTFLIPTFMAWFAILSKLILILQSAIQACLES